MHKGVRSEDNNHLAEEKKGEEMIIGGRMGCLVCLHHYYFLYNDEFNAGVEIIHGEVM